jgi:hypothetical protein
MKLFHENINVSVEHVTMPGVDKGSIILMKVPCIVQPSTRAASSSSEGKSSKKLAIVKTTRGSPTMIWLAIRVVKVSVILSFEKMINHGIKNEIPGTSLAIIINKETFFCLYHEIEYAAGKPSNKDSIVEATAMIVLFLRYRPYSFSTKTLI